MSSLNKMHMHNCKTVIIGASGVAAAVNLLEHVYDDFILIEAEERVAGRC